jgi:RimJ/RimL family protein N-acetyltransferase
LSGFDWAAELPTLRGSGLSLRGLRSEDASALFSVFGDPEVVRYWSSAPLHDGAAAERLIAEIHEHFRTRSLFQWGICTSESDQVIGTCTLYNLDLPHRRAEVGFALRRDTWGRGLAGEALDVLLGFAFDALGLHRIEADADPNNERSLRVLERRGFRREGYLRERWHHLGQVHDAIFLGLLRPEWTRDRFSR